MSDIENKIIHRCDTCNYDTDRLYNMNKHLKTEKHLLKLLSNSKSNRKPVQVNQVIKPGVQQKRTSKNDDAICEYCGKLIRRKRRMKNHHEICKEKIRIEKDRIIKELTSAKEEAEKKINEFKTAAKEAKDDKVAIEKEFFEYMKKSSPNKITTNNNIYNMYYILNNFNNAPDFKKLLNKPMTPEEREEIYKLGPNHGSVKYIQNRCIIGIDVEDRSLHCVDLSRNKFLYRENGAWTIDNNGKRIVKYAYEKIKDIFMDPLKKSTEEDVYDEDLNKRVEQLLLMESKGRPKILGMLSGTLLLKNNIP